MNNSPLPPALYGVGPEIRIPGYMVHREEGYFVTAEAPRRLFEAEPRKYVVCDAGAEWWLYAISTDARPGEKRELVRIEKEKRPRRTFGLLMLESLSIREFEHRDELIDAMNALTRRVKAFEVFRWSVPNGGYVRCEVEGI